MTSKKPAAPVTKHPENCECCQDSSIEAYLRKIEDIICRAGHAVIGTGVEDASGRTIAMSYTAGLADDGLPELIVFGLPAESALLMLNEAAKLLRAGHLPTDTPLHSIANLPVISKAVTPDRADHHINVANNRAKRLLPVLQMVWPDAQGQFPWSPEFDASMRPKQRLLFETN